MARDESVLTALWQLHDYGRALAERPIDSLADLAGARLDKARWGVYVTKRLRQLPNKDATQAFIEAGSFPLTLESPNLDREVRHFRELVLAQVIQLERLIGPRP